MNMQRKKVQRARQDMMNNQAAWNSPMHTNEERGTMPIHLTTLFTLAPAAMDKGDTQEVPCSYLYDNEPVRQVLVPKIQATAQMNTYLSPIPYIAFDEAGLTYYIKKGKVTKASNNGIAFDPIKEVIALNNTQKEAPIMPAKKKASVTPQVKPVATMTPLGVTPAIPSALDAILAAPIAPGICRGAQLAAEAVASMRQAEAEATAEAEVLRLTEEREEAIRLQAAAEAELDALEKTDVQPAYSLSADPLYVQLAQLVVGLQNKVENLEHRLLVKFLEAEQGQKAPEPEPEPVKEPDIWDILGDGTGAPTPVVAKPKSTLRISTQSTPAPKAARQGSGKTDPAIVKAIQQAWKSGKVTQADLAAKYGMDDKKVWYFCNRAKQLV